MVGAMRGGDRKTLRRSGQRNRKRPIQYDECRYNARWRVEAMACRLKGFHLYPPATTLLVGRKLRSRRRVLALKKICFSS